MGYRVMQVFRPLAHFAIRRSRWLLVGFVTLLAVASIYGVGAPDVLVAGGFQDPDSESQRVADVLDETFDMGEPDVIVAYSHPRLRVSDPQFASPLRSVLERLADRPEVEHVTSPFARPPNALVSHDRRIVLISIELVTNGEEEPEVVFQRIEPLLEVEGLTTTIGGTAPSILQAQEAAERDLVRGELIALPLVALLLILFFRGVVLAAVPLAVGGFAVVAALSCLRLLAHATDVSIFAMNIVTFLGLGVAIDYSLFMTSRFRDELRAGCDVPTAVERTVITAGRTIAYSGVAVAVSLIGLLVFPIMLLKSIALSGSLVVLMALLATLLFLPAALAALGHRINWLSFGSRRWRPWHVGYWHRLAGIVMRRPLAITLLTTAALLVLGAPFLRLNETVGGAAALPAESPAREIVDLMESDRFPSAMAMPVQVVLDLDEPPLSAAGRSKVERFAREASRIDGVQAVQSIAGTQPPEAMSMAPAVPPQALVHENMTVVSVTTVAPPEADGSREIVESLRALTVPGVKAHVGGRAAYLVDIRDAVTSRLPEALAIICAATFVVLFLAFGSIVMPIKAIVMNVLSLSASFGALVWIFQDGRFEGLLDYRSTGSIDLTIPVVMFAIVFGLAMDYELFLLSRIREAYDETRNNRTSVALGLEQTGRIITRAAVLLIAVMLGFIAADMLLVKQIGVGMAIAIAVDVTIVRALLVPATMELLGRYNWWAPAALTRLWHRLGAGVDERATA